MFNNNLITILLVLIAALINLVLSDETVPLKKIVIQDKVTYKMRHDFWPKRDQRKGILPFLEIISRKRRSPELDNQYAETEKRNVSDGVNLPPYLKENDNNENLTEENYEDFLTEVPNIDAVTELDSDQEFKIEDPNEDSTDLLVFDMDVAENTLIFRPLFAYRYKKRREKLNRENSVK